MGRWFEKGKNVGRVREQAQFKYFSIIVIFQKNKLVTLIFELHSGLLSEVQLSQCLNQDFRFE